jgi:uncharacterized damage-inducible protein DinB
MMKHPQTHLPGLLFVAAAGVLSVAALASAQSAEVSGLRADMIADISSVESKFVSLAEAMPASAYDWSPMEGVRSVGEVFCHVAAANFGIPRFFGVEAPAEAAALESKCETDDLESLKAGAVEVLRKSFVFAQEAIASVPDADLDDATKLFGRDTTKRAAMLLYVTHNHEHLGQSVAYARSNGVVPPWSTGS